MPNERGTRLAFFMLASVPFIFPYKFGPFNASGAETLSGLLILWVAAQAFKKSGGLIFPLWPSLLLVVSGIVAVAFGNHYATSFYALYVLGALLLIASVFSFNKIGVDAEEVVYGSLAWGLIFGGVVNSLVGIFQVLDLAKYAYSFVLYSSSNVPQGQLGQTNHYSDYLMVAVSAAVYLCVKKKINTTLFIGVSILLVFSMSLSSSRMIFLYAAMVGFVWAVGKFFVKNELPKELGKSLSIVSILFLLCIAAQYFSPFNSNGLVRLSQSMVMDGPNRWLYYRQAWDIFLQHPLFGVGFGNLADAVYQLYGQDGYPASGDQLPLAYCHNILLQILSEMGIFGGMSFLLLFMIFVIGMYRKEKSPEWFFIVMGGGGDVYSCSVGIPIILYVLLGCFLLLFHWWFGGMPCD